MGRKSSLYYKFRKQKSDYASEHFFSSIENFAKEMVSLRKEKESFEKKNVVENPKVSKNLHKEN